MPIQEVVIRTVATEIADSGSFQVDDDSTLVELGLDSLGVLMTLTKLAEIYKIDDKAFKTIPEQHLTIAYIASFIDKNKTNSPAADDLEIYLN